MKKFRVCKAIIAAVVASCMLSSCASILTGGSPSITIKGDIDETVSITTEKKTYNDVVLPAVVKVNRHKIEGQRIQITSKSYNFSDIVLEKKVNGMAFGNILIGGLIGLAIDLATNCVSVPAQTEYILVPQPKENK